MTKIRFIENVEHNDWNIIEPDLNSLTLIVLKFAGMILVSVQEKEFSLPYVDMYSRTLDW